MLLPLVSLPPRMWKRTSLEALVLMDAAETRLLQLRKFAVPLSPVPTVASVAHIRLLTVELRPQPPDPANCAMPPLFWARVSGHGRFGDGADLLRACDGPSRT